MSKTVDGFYQTEVERSHGSIMVSVTIVGQAPDGGGRRDVLGYEYEYVYEPCWLLRLFGETLERRVERAKARLAHKAESMIATQKRLDAVVDAVRRRTE